jgi:hypothetical protein
MKFISVILVFLIFYLGYYNIQLERNYRLTINNNNRILDSIKENYDSLHVEHTILSNQYDRFTYSLEHIRYKYPKVVDEFTYYLENETE